MHNEDDDSRYMTSEQIRAREEAKKPWWKRAGNAVLEGCSIGVVVIGVAGTSIVLNASRLLA
ncbi:MAG: hypothetical protein AAF559_05840 [Pseudomonadota bacterium]